MTKEFTTISGELVDVSHLATVHGSGADGYVDIWTEERQEIWLRQADNTETQIMIPGHLFPARTGHRVTLLVDHGAVIGLINWSTGMQVNYLLAGRPGAFRPVDAAVVGLTLVATAVQWGFGGLPMFIILVLVYSPIVWLKRSRRHTRRVCDVEARLVELIEQRRRPTDAWEHR